MLQISRLFLVFALTCFVACKEESAKERIATMSPEDQAKFDELLEMTSTTSMQSEQAVTIKGSTVVGMELVKDMDFPSQFIKKNEVEQQRKLMSLSAVTDLSRGDAAYLFFYASSENVIEPITAGITVVTPQDQRIFSFKDVVIWPGDKTSVKLAFRPSPFFLKLPFEKTFPVGQYRVEAKLNAGTKEEILLKKTINLE